MSEKKPQASAPPSKGTRRGRKKPSKDKAARAAGKRSRLKDRLARLAAMKDKDAADMRWNLLLANQQALVADLRRNFPKKQWMTEEE